jgi:arylsulfatase A
MLRREFLRSVTAGGVWASQHTLRAASSQPNIIFIYADDLGYGDLACYGSKLRTPNLNRLAGDGARLTQFYSASAVCSPSRAALLTGGYPVRAGVPFVISPGDTWGIDENLKTIGDVMRSAGYRTMCAGKWHLGNEARYQPNARGFDEYVGIPYSHDMSPLPFIVNGTVTIPDVPVEGLTARYTEEAVDFIRRSKDGPFFLYLAQSSPHIPLAPSARFRRNNPMGVYGNCVEELDWSVGQIVRAVAENGLEANTLIVFTSDNGPWYQGSVGGLRGRKGQTMEGGFRVPFIAKCPNLIPKGQVLDSMATTMDMLPTFARLAGAPLPAQQLDGVDIMPLLSGQTTTVARAPFLYMDGYHIQCARIGNWKLHVSRYNLPPYLRSIPLSARQNLPLPRPELYDVVEDPTESAESGRDQPEVVEQILGEIQTILANMPEPVQMAWRETMKIPVESTPVGGYPVRIG